MQLGMIGLGRMGANLVRRLMRDGHECVAFDRDADIVARAGTFDRVDTGMMTIGKLADRLGLNPRTIRYYEGVELIPPAQRSEGGYRLYTPADEDRIRFIKSAQRLGLTLGEIRETLAFRERGERPCQYVAGLIDERLGEVNERLRELRAFKRELTGLRQRMRTDGPVERDGPYCHYIQDSPQPA